MCGGWAQFSPKNSHVIRKRTFNATLMTGHYADPANCYKFNILLQNCSTQYFTILIWDWGRLKIARIDSQPHTTPASTLWPVECVYGTCWWLSVNCLLWNCECWCRRLIISFNIFIGLIDYTYISYPPLLRVRFEPGTTWGRLHPPAGCGRHSIQMPACLRKWGCKANICVKKMRTK